MAERADNQLPTTTPAAIPVSPLKSPSTGDSGYDYMHRLMAEHYGEPSPEVASRSKLPIQQAVGTLEQMPIAPELIGDSAVNTPMGGGGSRGSGGGGSRKYRVGSSLSSQPATTVPTEAGIPLIVPGNQAASERALKDADIDTLDTLIDARSLGPVHAKEQAEQGWLSERFWDVIGMLDNIDNLRKYAYLGASGLIDSLTDDTDVNGWDDWLAGKAGQGIGALLSVGAKGAGVIRSVAELGPSALLPGAAESATAMDEAAKASLQEVAGPEEREGESAWDLWDQMGRKLWQAAASGQLSEVAYSRPSLSGEHWGPAAKAAADRVGLGDTLFTADGRVPTLSTLDLLDYGVSKEDAAKLALKAGSRMERDFWGGFTNDFVRMGWGMLGDVFLDPMWLLGPAAGTKLLAVGDEVLSISAPVVKAAALLQDVATGDDGIRLLVRAIQGDAESVRVVTDSIGRARAAAQEARQAADQLSQATPEAALADARQTLARAQQQLSAVEQAYGSSPGVTAEGIATVRRQMEALADLTTRIEQSPKKWVRAHIQSNLARASRLTRQADMAETLLRGRFTDVATRKGLLAFAMPGGTKTRYLIPSEVSDLIRPINARISSSIRPFSFGELHGRWLAQEARQAGSGLSAFGPGERIAYAIHGAHKKLKYGDALRRLPAAALSLFARVFGTRAFQPWVMAVEAYAKLAGKEEAAILERVAPLLTSGGAHIALPGVPKEIWASYQEAISKFFDTLGARDHFIRASLRRVVEETSHVFSVRKAMAREWVRQNRPLVNGQPTITTQGRQIRIDPAWAEDSYHQGVLFQEIAGLTESGAGILRERPELAGAVALMDDLVRETRQLFTNPDGSTPTLDALNQELVRVVRSYHGNEQALADWQKLVDSARAELHTAQQEANAASVMAAAAETQASKQAAALKRLRQILTPKGLARLFMEEAEAAGRVPPLKVDGSLQPPAPPGSVPGTSAVSRIRRMWGLSEPEAILLQQKLTEAVLIDDLADAYQRSQADPDFFKTIGVVDEIAERWKTYKGRGIHYGETPPPQSTIAAELKYQGYSEEEAIAAQKEIVAQLMAATGAPDWESAVKILRTTVGGVDTSSIAVNLAKRIEELETGAKALHDAATSGNWAAAIRFLKEDVTKQVNAIEQQLSEAIASKNNKLLYRKWVKDEKSLETLARLEQLEQEKAYTAASDYLDQVESAREMTPAMIKLWRQRLKLDQKFADAEAAQTALLVGAKLGADKQAAVIRAIALGDLGAMANDFPEDVPRLIATLLGTGPSTNVLKAMENNDLPGLIAALKANRATLEATAQTSEDTAKGLAIVLKEAEKRVKMVEGAIQELDKGKPLASVWAEPGEVINGRNVGKQMLVGQQVRRSVTPREQYLWDQAVARRGTLSEEDWLLACFAVLRQYQDLPARSGDLGRRLGEVPEDVRHIVQDMTAMVRQYEAWYGDAGMRFMADPVERLREWGVVNYLPHILREPEAVGRGLRMGHGVAAAKSVEHASVDRLFNTSMPAKRFRTLAGTIDEINHADLGFSLDVTPARLLDRYIQSNRVINAVETMAAFVRAGIIRRIEPTRISTTLPDGTVVQSIRETVDELAMAQGMVPIFDRPNRLRDLDLLLTGTQEEWARLGVSAQELQEAITELSKRSPENSPWQNWTRGYAEAQDQANIMALVIQRRLAQVGTAAPLWEVDIAVQNHMANGLTRDAAIREVTRELNEIATAQGMSRIRPESVEAFVTEQPWKLYIPARIQQSLVHIFEPAIPDKNSLVGKTLLGAKKINDMLTEFWKVHVTIIATAFHAKNFLSNKLAEAFSGGLWGALNPSRNATAATFGSAMEMAERFGSVDRGIRTLIEPGRQAGETAVEWAARKAEAALVRRSALFTLWRDGIDLGDGVHRSADEAVALLSEHGVLNRGFTGIGSLDEWEESVAHWVHSWWDNPKLAAWDKIKSYGFDAVIAGLAVGGSGPGGLLLVVPKKLGAWIGRRTEALSRMTLFLTHMEQSGGNIAESAAQVQKHLFNYDDLTEVQKVWVRSLFPFFTWTQKNLLLQLELLFEKPWAYNKLNQLMGTWFPKLATEADRMAGNHPAPLDPTDSTERPFLRPDQRTRYQIRIPFLGRGRDTPLHFTNFGTPIESAFDLMQSLWNGKLPAYMGPIWGGAYAYMTEKNTYSGHNWTENPDGKQLAQQLTLLHHASTLPVVGPMYGWLHDALVEYAGITAVASFDPYDDHEVFTGDPEALFFLNTLMPLNRVMSALAGYADAYQPHYQTAEDKAKGGAIYLPESMRFIRGVTGLGTMFYEAGEARKRKERAIKNEMIEIAEEKKILREQELPRVEQ